MGKGGGSQPTTQTVQQSNIPEYARPYFEDIMTRGQAASQVQYQPYSGERVAPFSPMQEQAFQGISQLGPSPLLGTAAGLTGLGAKQAAQAGEYNPLTAGEVFGRPGAMVGTGSFAQPGVAGVYMSPYMQNVVDIQTREAQRQADIARIGRQAQATGMGAFGGSRQAIMEAEAARNLAQQKGDIQATGQQAAFQQAQQTYQADAARQLQARLANQQAGLAGLQAAEQSRQFGAGLGMQGVQQLLGAAGQLGQLGQTAYGQQVGTLQAQQQAGAQQQAQAQQMRDLGYEEFMRQQLYPQSQLQFLSSLLRGSVVAPQQTMYTYQQAPSLASQLGGIGMGIYGLSRAGGMKEGGEVKSYALGGVTEGAFASNISKLVKLGLSDPRLIDQDRTATPLEKNIAKMKVAQMRQAFSNQQALDRGIPSEEPILSAGVGSLDTPEFTAAEGGIVAFQQGGTSLVPFQPKDVIPLHRPNWVYGTGRVPFQWGQAAGAAARAGGIGGLALYSPEAGRGSDLPGTSTSLSQEEALSKVDEIDAQLQSLQNYRTELKKLGIGGLRGRVSGLTSENTGLDNINREIDDLSRLRRQLTRGSGTPFIGVDIAQARYKARTEPSEQREGIAPAAPAGIDFQTANDAAQQKAGLGALLSAATPGATPSSAPQPAPRASEAAAPAAVASTTGYDKFFDPLSKEIGRQEGIQKGMETREQAETRRREQLAKEFPSELPDRFKEFASEAQDAIKQRDQDRWLAVAMGGFAAAAGESPYALKNFAQGLGLTTKEFMSINKDFQAAEKERKKMELALRQQDRAERMGLRKEELAAGDRAQEARDKKDEYLAGLRFKLGETKLGVQLAQDKLNVERQKAAAAQAGVAESRATREENREAARRDALAQRYGREVNDLAKLIHSGMGVSAVTDPNAAVKAEAQARRIVLQRNPQYKEVAGEIEAPAAGAVRRYNPATGKLE